MSASRGDDRQGAHVSVDADDVRFMRRALELAEQGAGQVAPNPKVGAVIVQDGRIVGEGWHQRYGGPHAEVHALQAAGRAARGATAYVSLEPCNHHGQTPPCTDALIEAGVARVVCAARDPNPKAAGGMERLQAAGIVVHTGVCEEHALLANAAFFHHARWQAQHQEQHQEQHQRQHQGRHQPQQAHASKSVDAALPFVVLKLAVSIDGAIVDASRRRGWLTGPEAHRAVHALRAEADAVAVGIGTALADDPSLTVCWCRHRGLLLRVVFDRQARLPLDSTRRLPGGAGAGGDPSGVPSRVAALEAAGVAVSEATSARDASCNSARRRVCGTCWLRVGRNWEHVARRRTRPSPDYLSGSVILGAGAVPAFAAYPPWKPPGHHDCGCSSAACSAPT